MENISPPPSSDDKEAMQQMYEKRGRYLKKARDEKKRKRIEMEANSQQVYTLVFNENSTFS